ncbi:MAG: LytTR family DNA-binding domain-containing protein [Imperialibacter sp.]|uniref:LytR/AlgR family response regulator transcription factor n=1 Tax=Imperialibacter sp. TaxID=2038411 RepID=UPI0032EADD8D
MASSEGDFWASQRWKIVKVAGLLMVFAVLLRLIQDYLHAYINDYHFYFSESIIHKGFWFVFFPVSILQGYAIGKFSNRFSRKVKLAFLAVLTILATLVHLVSFAFIISTAYSIFLNHSYSFINLLRYSFSQDTYLCLLIYGISALVFSRLDAEKLKTSSEQRYLTAVMVGSGAKTTAVSVNDIFYVSSASPYIALHTATRKFLHSETLKALGEQLNQQQFVRIHKSTIVNIKEVESYQSRLNGDYDITLKNGEVVRMSRNYSTSFKAQFK